MNAKEIESGLWQSPLHSVIEEWNELRQHVDIIVVMTLGGDLTAINAPLVMHFPIPDDPGGCEQIGQVRMLARILSSYRVLTVCQMGENRSGLLSALILQARGASPEEAVQTVQQKGPATTDPERGSFWNPGFVQQILA